MRPEDTSIEEQIARDRGWCDEQKPTTRGSCWTDVQERDGTGRCSRLAENGGLLEVGLYADYLSTLAGSLTVAAHLADPGGHIWNVRREQVPNLVDTANCQEYRFRTAVTQEHNVPGQRVRGKDGDRGPINGTLPAVPSSLDPPPRAVDSCKM